MINICLACISWSRIITFFFWAELSVIPTARAKDPSVFGKAPREEKMGRRKKVLSDSLIADGWHVSS